MNNHKRHKFVKESVEIKEEGFRDRYGMITPRKVTIYKCECKVIDVTYRMPWDNDLVLDFYYSDPIVS